MSITLHTGNPRTGKTYGMTKEIVRALDEGFIVYSNYKIKWNGKIRHKFNFWKLRFEKIEYPSSNLRYWSKLSDLFNVQNGIIAMDEAHVYLNSRRWADMPEEMERKLAQHGKDGLHIIGTVQSLRRLDTIMRELIDYWYSYRVFPPPPRHPWKRHRPLFFLRNQIIRETDITPYRRLKFPAIIWFRKSVAKKYNTLEKIIVDKKI